MNLKRTAAAITMAAMAAFPTIAGANTTSYWNQAGILKFFQGKFNGTALSSDGRVLLGYKMEKKFETTEPYVWAIALDSKGVLWAGSGNKAILYSVDKKGVAKEAAILPGVGVSSILIDKNDNVYAAAMPGGEIFKIDSKGEKTLYAKVPASYVWDMKIGADGAIYCVTGMPAGAHKIKAANDVATLYTSPETHFLSMFLDNNGNIIAGSSPGGLIVKINVKEAENYKGSADFGMSGEGIIARLKSSGDKSAEDSAGVAKLLQELEEALKSTAGKDGTVVNPDNKEEVEKPADPRVKVILDLDEEEAYRLLPLDDGSFLVAANRNQAPAPPVGMKNPPKPAKIEPLSFPIGQQPPPNGMLPIPASLYRALPDGRRSLVLQIPDPYIMSLHKIDADNVLVGTGNDGRLYSMNIKTDSATLQTIPAAQVLAFAGSGDNLRIATGNPGTALAPSSARMEEGSFTSSINDASTTATYGNMDAVATVPGKSTLEFKTRTGNTPDPDDGSWSDWSKPSAQWPVKVKSAPGRYAQYMAVMKPSPDGESPSFKEVRIYYVTANQSPDIDSFTVSPQPQNKPMPQSQTGGQQPPPQPQGGPGGQNPQESNLVVGSVQASDEIVFKWVAKDDDMDALLSKIEFRRTGDTAWSLIQKDEPKNEYRWNTTAIPDGIYEAKLTVSDYDSNTKERALFDEEYSDPFTIDHSRPVVSIEEIKSAGGGKYTAKARVSDSTSIISAVEYTTDNQRWHILFPDDLIFDSREETFTLNIEPEGTEPVRLLLVRAADFVGNAGSASRSVGEK